MATRKRWGEVSALKLVKRLPERRRSNARVGNRPRSTPCDQPGRYRSHAHHTASTGISSQAKNTLYLARYAAIATSLAMSGARVPATRGEPLPRRDAP